MPCLLLYALYTQDLLDPAVLHTLTAQLVALLLSAVAAGAW